MTEDNKIEIQLEKIKLAVSQLDSRISLFEQFLQNYPARTKAEIKVSNFVLAFLRKKDSWGLFILKGIEEKPILTASLADRIMSVYSFKNLIKEIHARNESLLSDVSIAVEWFDSNIKNTI